MRHDGQERDSGRCRAVLGKHRRIGQDRLHHRFVHRVREVEFPVLRRHGEQGKHGTGGGGVYELSGAALRDPETTDRRNAVQSSSQDLPASGRGG